MSVEHYRIEKRGVSWWLVIVSVLVAIAIGLVVRPFILPTQTTGDEIRYWVSIELNPTVTNRIDVFATNIVTIYETNYVIRDAVPTNASNRFIELFNRWRAK